MRKTILLGLFLFSTTFIFAQQPAEFLKIGKISGKIVDAATGTAMEYATVSIFREKDSALVTGGTTEPNGNFKITDIPIGKYYVLFDFLGYKKLKKSGINITTDNFDIKLKEIALEPYSGIIEGVDIVAERPLYQNQIDRKIINPEQDVMSAGGSALNVLENAPSVEVDIEGNVALRGNTSVTILIDGRPSGYSGESAGELLQQIPANAIDKIELITNPSSKYNPEGITGIINIVMKKNTFGGFNGSVNAGIGTNLSYNAGGNFNYRNDKINFYSNVSLNQRKFEMEGESHRETYYDGKDLPITYDQKSKRENDGLGAMARAGIDFFINKKNTFSLTGDINGNKNNSDQIGDYLEYDRFNTAHIDQLRNHYKTDINGDGNRFSYSVGGLWDKKFSSKDHFLAVDLSFGKRSNDNTSTYEQYDYDIVTDTISNINYPAFRQNLTDNYTQDLEGKIDYAMPIGKQSKLELGGSTRLRTIENSLDVARLRNGIYVSDPNSANDFIYDENVYALYGQFGSKINHFSYQAGLRGEYADIHGDLKAIEQDTSFPQNYWQVYPTAFIMYEINKVNELKLNYSRRVNRPGPWNLNPFQDVSDPMNIRSGNPELKPEYINSLEMSYFRYIKKGTASATLYYRNTTDVISRITEISEDGVNISTWANLNTNDAFGLELSFNYKFFDLWMLNTNGNVSYNKISGDNNMNNDGMSWGLRVNNSFQVAANTSVQANLQYNGPRIMAQGQSDGFVTCDLGFKQDFLDKKLSLTLRVSDIFNSRKFASTSEGEYFYQDNYMKPKSLVGYLTLTWKFGNMQIRDQKRRIDTHREQESDDTLEMSY